jgi:16S rRNA (guanine1207-N2)-methyltransferase
LIDQIPRFAPRRVLCTSLGRAQFAAEAAAEWPEAEVACLFLDRYLVERAAHWWLEPPPNLRLLCEADFPDGPFDLAALPLSRRGEAELAWDLMQSAYERLDDRGTLLVAVDNPQDTWVHERMRTLFAKVTRIPERRGAAYAAVKTGPLKKRKSFEHEFAFRDGERLYKVVTRPGVFSHRRLDIGTRALLEVMQVRPHARVLELGCGAGPLCFAAAGRAEHVEVLGLDANPRSVECTRRGADLNGLSNVRAELSADARVADPGAYDLVLANPPYFSNFRIAELFVEGAASALKKGGRIQVVTKNAAWFTEHLPAQFRNVIATENRGYAIVSATK